MTKKLKSENQPATQVKKAFSTSSFSISLTFVFLYEESIKLLVNFDHHGLKWKVKLTISAKSLEIEPNKLIELDLNRQCIQICRLSGVLQIAKTT